MAAIFQTTLSNAFSWMKILEFRLQFHWSLFLRFQLTIIQHWFRLWLGAVQATSHYLNQWWLFYWRIYASLGLNELKEIFAYLEFIKRPISCLWYVIVKLWSPKEFHLFFSWLVCITLQMSWSRCCCLSRTVYKIVCVSSWATVVFQRSLRQKIWLIDCYKRTWNFTLPLKSQKEIPQFRI